MSKIPWDERTPAENRVVVEHEWSALIGWLVAAAFFLLWALDGRCP